MYFYNIVLQGSIGHSRAEYISNTLEKRDNIALYKISLTKRDKQLYNTLKKYDYIVLTRDEYGCITYEPYMN